MKAKLNTLLDELHGKIERDDENGTITVFRKKNGKQEAYTMKVQASERTPAQKAHTAQFQLACKQAKTILDNPALCQQWQAEYDLNDGIFNGRKYATLRGYIIGKKSQNA